MTFTEALDAVFKDNDRVTRIAWSSRTIYLLLDDGRLCIKGGVSIETGRRDDDTLSHPFILTEQDFFAHDWEVVTDA